RSAGFVRLAPGAPVEPPVAYPEDTLSYLANVFNQAAHRFYAEHGVKVIAPAYEAIHELGEVSLMITKHCVRFSLSLCPKQAKGVTGVQGQVKAEPLQLINGKEKLTLRFDCKPCEMHVVGKMKKGVANQSRNELLQATQGVPMTFFKTRPKQEFGH
ncbi:MAG: collagenase-like protease, partial [Rhodoferax sp.]